MAVVSYEQWYSLTYERFNWRGSELTGVDNALKAYHPAPGEPTGQRPKMALDTYIAYLAKNNPDWQKSSRRSRRATRAAASPRCATRSRTSSTAP